VLRRGTRTTARSRIVWTVAVLGALFAAMVAWAILAVEGPDAAARLTHERDARALPFAPGDVTAVAIAPRSAPELRLERTAGGWRLLSPAEGAATALAVEGLLDRLSAMRVRTSLPTGPGALAARGLDPPAARLTLTLAGGRTLSLDLGDESAFDRTRFGRAGGEMLVIEGVPAAAVDPAPDAFLAAKAGR
jgi:hypothetical protein